MTGSNRVTLPGTTRVGMGKPIDIQNFLLTLSYLETFLIEV